MQRNLQCNDRGIFYIQISPEFDAKATSDAEALLLKWLRFEIVLTAFLLFKFSIIRHASHYLQTKGLDYLSAWVMVEDAKGKLTRLQWQEIHTKAKKFIDSMKQSRSPLPNEVYNEFQPRRVGRKTIMRGENAPDEAIRDPLQSFRVQIFRPVIDQITTSINERFSVNAELIKNTASFDPQRFDELLKNGIPLESVEKIANIIDVPWSSLRSELLSFISVFKSLGRT